MSLSFLSLVPGCYLNETMVAFAAAYDKVWLDLLAKLDSLPADTVFPTTTLVLDEWLEDQANPLQTMLPAIEASRLRPLAAKLLWWYQRRGQTYVIKTIGELVIPTVTITVTTALESCWKLGHATRSILGATTVLLGEKGFYTLRVTTSRPLTDDERRILKLIIVFSIPANTYYQVIETPVALP